MADSSSRSPSAGPPEGSAIEQALLGGRSLGSITDPVEALRRQAVAGNTLLPPSYIAAVLGEVQTALIDVSFEARERRLLADASAGVRPLGDVLKDGADLRPEQRTRIAGKVAIATLRSTNPDPDLVARCIAALHLEGAEAYGYLDMMTSFLAEHFSLMTAQYANGNSYPAALVEGFANALTNACTLGRAGARTPAERAMYTAPLRPALDSLLFLTESPRRRLEGSLTLATLHGEQGELGQQLSVLLSVARPDNAVVGGYAGVPLEPVWEALGAFSGTAARLGANRREQVGGADEGRQISQLSWRAQAALLQTRSGRWTQLATAGLTSWLADELAPTGSNDVAMDLAKTVFGAGTERNGKILRAVVRGAARHAAHEVERVPLGFQQSAFHPLLAFARSVSAELPKAAPLVVGAIDEVLRERGRDAGMRHPVIRIEVGAARQALPVVPKAARVPAGRTL